jgi:phage gp45-like
MGDQEARIAMLERQVAALTRRLGTPFTLARSTVAPNDAGAVQTIQGQLDALSTRDAMPVLYHYGFTGSPPIGTDKLVAFLDGDRSKGLVIATGHQEYRLTGLANGEVAIYDMLGRYVKLAQSGIVMNAAAGPVTIENATTVTVDAALLRCTGDIIDNYTTQTETLANQRAIYDSHTHNVDNIELGGSTRVSDVPNQQET